MQKKLQRLDEIIRNSFTDGQMRHPNYMEATELLVELSNELKLLNLHPVINWVAITDSEQPEQYTEVLVII